MRLTLNNVKLHFIGQIGHLHKICATYNIVSAFFKHNVIYLHALIRLPETYLLLLIGYIS